VIRSLLTVDGKRLWNEETDTLHLDELVSSIYGYGPFEIYTCGCGYAMCAGIAEDIVVDQDGGNVLWTVPRPLKTPAEGDMEYDHFVFDRAQYRQAIQDGLEAAKRIADQHAGEIDIGPHGFTVDKLNQLTTAEPDQVVDRRLRERIVKVVHGPGLVDERYICRVVKEEDTGRGFKLWVEGWTGTEWARNTEPHISMDAADKAIPALASVLAEAGVPDDPFPPGYESPRLGNNRYGL